MTDYKVTQSVELPEKHFPVVSLGVGGIVKDSHYPAYKKAGFPVAGLYDLNTERAVEMRKLFNVPAVYDSLEAAVSQAPTDAIFDIALPPTAILDLRPHIPDAPTFLTPTPMLTNL